MNKPKDWKSRKYPATPYGELKFINISRDVAMYMLEDEIDREIADPESGVVMPKPGAGDFRELLNIDLVVDQVEWVVSQMRARRTVALSVKSEAGKVSAVLDEECERTMREFQEHYDTLKGPGDSLQRQFFTENFLRDAKKMFHSALRREQGGAGMWYTGRNGEVISSIEVMGGLAA